MFLIRSSKVNYFKALLSNFLKVSALVVCGFCKNSEIELKITRYTLLDSITILSKHSLFKFTYLADLLGVDHILENLLKKFSVNYILTSFSTNSLVQLSLFTKKDPILPSITGTVFASSNWLEREVWDMFGIFFFKHPDLRRILTDYGFKGHPLRKDFPLVGFVEVNYDFLQKKIKNKKNSFFQTFRITS